MLVLLLHVHARHRHRSRRLLLRRRHDGCVPGQPALRLDQPVRADDHRTEPAADVDRLDRRRHLVERQRQRHGGLRGRTHAVDEQLVPRATSPVRARCPGRASQRSRRSTASPSRGTPATSGGSEASRCPVTPDGLWVGSDTDHAGNEFHQKIAFFPAEGGIAPPADRHVRAPERPLQHGSGGRRCPQPSLLQPDARSVPRPPCRSGSIGGTRAAHSC